MFDGFGLEGEGMGQWLGIGQRFVLAIDHERITGNPSLTRRWPFGRVTEGLPTNHPERHMAPCSGLNK
jgi:hypothetical protein